jgi:hypothetical protein
MAEAELAQNFFERHRDKIAFGGPEQCWLWAAGQFARGYGGVWDRGKMRKVHRVAYETVHGQDSADGFVVRHKCDVRNCVNPAHLELGTQADNVRDMNERGRQVTPKGEAHPRAKLTEDDVRTIRSMYVYGSSDLGRPGLARRFGVSPQAIGDIITRKGWPHVA